MLAIYTLSNGAKLVKMRNPWARALSEWTGAYCDTDVIWTMKNRKGFTYCSEVKCLNNKSDGNFFMTITDF
jgi:hypothetical protein